LSAKIPTNLSQLRTQKRKPEKNKQLKRVKNSEKKKNKYLRNIKEIFKVNTKAKIYSIILLKKIFKEL